MEIKWNFFLISYSRPPRLIRCWKLNPGTRCGSIFLQTKTARYSLIHVIIYPLFMNALLTWKMMWIKPCRLQYIWSTNIMKTICLTRRFFWSGLIDWATLKVPPRKSAAIGKWYLKRLCANADTFQSLEEAHQGQDNSEGPIQGAGDKKTPFYWDN